MAKNCYVKKGIRELDISDELRHQLNRLLLNNDSLTESSLSDYEENDLNIIEEDSTTDYQTDSGCERVGKCICNQINVITDEDKKLLDILEKVSDPIIKNEILNKFLDLNKPREPTNQNNDSFDLQEIFSRFSKRKEVTIHDLKEELNTFNNKINQVNYLTEEIHNLKINDQLQNQYNKIE